MLSAEARECFEKYQSNAAFANDLELAMPTKIEWTSVLRFYAALHLINAFLIDKANVEFNTASAAHELRKQAMKRCPELRDAPDHFRELKDMSEKVRYDPRFKYTTNHHTLCKRLLSRIVAIVEPKLKRS